MKRDEFEIVLLAYGSTMFSLGVLAASDNESEKLQRTADDLRERLLAAFRDRRPTE